MKKTIASFLAGACFFSGVAAALADSHPTAKLEGQLAVELPLEQAGKMPLTEAFDQLVILPYDYNGKVFSFGQKVDISGDYEIAMRDNRVLVPIRLLGSLVSHLENHSYWQVNWDQQKPNEVLLVNHNLGKTVQFAVGSKTVKINGDPVQIDVAPQKINGRILLPLRVAAETMETHIDWLDGLILIGDISVDLQSGETEKAKDQIKTELADSRQPVDDEERAFLLAQFGDTILYYKTMYSENDYRNEMYRLDSSGKEVRVDLPGKPYLYSATLIGEKLYFVAEEKRLSGENAAAVYTYHIPTKAVEKIAGIDSWDSSWGSIGWFKPFDNGIYMVVRYGDLTMGSDTLFEMEEGSLKKMLTAKNFGQTIKEGETIYYSDFNPMLGGWDNLFRANIVTGKKTALGKEGFNYGVFREATSGGGASYSGGAPLILYDGHLYTLGYEESNWDDPTAIYRVSLSGRSHEKLAAPARDFWLEEDAGHIYYIDAETGFLMRTDVSGKGVQTLFEHRIVQAHRHEGMLYIIVNPTGGRYRNGKLYAYSIADDKATELVERSVQSILVGDAGVYFIADGYEPGLFKVDSEGRIETIADDNIFDARLTEDGLIYTLTYEKGAFSLR